MAFHAIVGTALGAAILVPIGMTFLPPSTARRIALAAWALLLPALVISCGLLASQGERGFLSNSQAVSAGALLMLISFGLGWGASWVSHAKG